MADEKEIYNVEELHEHNKNKLLEAISTQILSQYRGKCEENENNNSKVIIKWILNTLFDDNFLLGLRHWTLWQYQKGEIRYKSIFYNFNIQKQFNNVILSDEDFEELIKISLITKLSGENFIKTAKMILEQKSKILKGLYSDKNFFLYLIEYESTELLDAILFFKKLYKPIENTYILQLKKNDAPFLFLKEADYNQPYNTCGYWYDPDNNGQCMVNVLSASDFIRII